MLCFMDEEGLAVRGKYEGPEDEGARGRKALSKCRSVEVSKGGRVRERPKGSEGLRRGRGERSCDSRGLYGERMNNLPLRTSMV